MTIKTMTQDTKDQIANLERQKIALEDQLEFVGNNLVKMHELEQEIFEIEEIIIFTEALGYVENAHIDHGTVYANFTSQKDAKSYKQDLQNFMNDFYVGDTKVKEWKLWKANDKDVYAFDIMEDEYVNIPHDVDVAINLENESRLGK